ncbi:ubiquitin carboxyl-terminal hydrolase 42-like [Vidua chalybeata]|uniref:ubiquitin carboxyl-terminal hydrolase 42-like n=1 Tax=Vidua chalybeata TaxID=81927 RepID=UPI0023A7F102|nr:ubiquitin carboxyl-terminal hydrolase 42-like [Vidua chalybeata]XP_053819399.1 ubiquitin carboxyl-terminal hydrolase 42-like [Vidua chalybeata]XP_053819400.1 ubiquitin carboxyl-terminal hydrolase 42-like [Vidua chalybeata]
MTPPQKTLFPPEKICMDWRQKRRPGAGLFNLGSTCYLNVVLQCLTYTPPLANYLLSRQHSQLCHQQGFCMMCIMEDHVRKVLYSSATAIRPRAVIRHLKFIGEFKPDIPGDAYEFLRCTLNAMHRACLSGSSDLDVSSQETTIIHQIFGGFLRSRVTCLSCKTVFDFFKVFLDVLLKIKGASSLTTALEDFVKPKQMDGKKFFKCSKCKKKVAASKMVTVHHAPRVLTVCLGRADHGSSRKLSQVVEYPEYLDLRPYMSDPAGEPVLFSLYAVVVHNGHTCLGGHFFCYTKASNGQWYKMNDVFVDSCGIHTVLGQQAYLLFYARCSHSQVEEMASSSSFHSFLSQGEASSQAGSAGAQGLPGRVGVTNSQRNSARERQRSRSPQWGNERRRSSMNTTNHNNSAGRRRKRTSPPDHDNTDSDATASEPSKRSFQPPPEQRAAHEQPLLTGRDSRADPHSRAASSADGL